MEHKHAAFFRAVADGTGDEWECLGNFWHRKEFSDAVMYADEIAIKPDDWTVRRKQKTRVVNGFIVPAPMDVAPAHGDDYYISDTSAMSFSGFTKWFCSEFDFHMLKVGNVFSTREAAIANAKAMLNINPN